MSGSYLTPPLLTQPADGAHFEHEKYKRGARDFVLSHWKRPWLPLRESNLRRVPLQVYASECFRVLPSASPSASGCFWLLPSASEEADYSLVAACTCALGCHTRILPLTLLLTRSPLVTVSL